MKNFIRFLIPGLFVAAFMRVPVYAVDPGLIIQRDQINIIPPTSIPTPTMTFIQIDKSILVTIKPLATITPTITSTPSVGISASPTAETNAATASANPGGTISQPEKTGAEQTATAAAMTQRDKIFLGIMAALALAIIIPPIWSKIKKPSEKKPETPPDTTAG